MAREPCCSTCYSARAAEQPVVGSGPWSPAPVGRPATSRSFATRPAGLGIRTYANRPSAAPRRDSRTCSTRRRARSTRARSPPASTSRTAPTRALAACSTISPTTAHRRPAGTALSPQADGRSGSAARARGRPHRPPARLRLRGRRRLRRRRLRPGRGACAARCTATSWSCASSRARAAGRRARSCAS